MKMLALAALLLGLSPRAAADGLESLGLTYYSNGRQERMSGPEIMGMDVATLRARLQDIGNHSSYLRSWGDPPFCNASLYPEILDETIASAIELRSYIAVRGADVSAAAERAALLESFKKEFETLRDEHEKAPKPQGCP